MMEERSFHPLDYLSVLRRRKRWFLVPLGLSLVLGTLAAIFLPKEYQSKASIAVAAPTLSPELLKGVSSLDSTERQRAIQQYLLSSAVLERVVREERFRIAERDRAERRLGIGQHQLAHADYAGQASVRVDAVHVVHHSGGGGSQPVEHLRHQKHLGHGRRPRVEPTARAAWAEVGHTSQVLGT